MGVFTSNTTEEENDLKAFFFHTSKCALIIFTRNPELGKVKTRLARTIGDEAALNIYKFLLEHTVAITRGLEVDKYVYYSENIAEKDLWDEKFFRKRLQDGSDLGKRMEQAFQQLLNEGYERVIIVGSDLYDLDQNDIQRAFDALLNHDYVVGPASDGGYYLLGMTSMTRNIFRNKTWGESNVLRDTLKDLSGKKYAMLETRNDVDRYEDIADIDIFKPFLKHIN